MKKAPFWTLFAIMNLLFIFIKIYQHNVYTNLSYHNQRLQEIKKKLNLEKNKNLIALLNIKKELLETSLTDTTMKTISLLHIQNVSREDNDKA
jgi:hypothetical protein